MCGGTQIIIHDLVFVKQATKQMNFLGFSDGRGEQLLFEQARKPRSYASLKLRLTDSLTDLLTRVKCRATSVAKNLWLAVRCSLMFASSLSLTFGRFVKSSTLAKLTLHSSLATAGSRWLAATRVSEASTTWLTPRCLRTDELRAPSHDQNTNYHVP